MPGYNPYTSMGQEIPETHQIPSQGQGYSSRQSSQQQQSQHPQGQSGQTQHAAPVPLANPYQTPRTQSTHPGYDYSPQSPAPLPPTAASNTAQATQSPYDYMYYQQSSNARSQAQVQLPEQPPIQPRVHTANYDYGEETFPEGYLESYGNYGSQSQTGQTVPPLPYSNHENAANPRYSTGGHSNVSDMANQSYGAYNGGAWNSGNGATQTYNDGQGLLAPPMLGSSNHQMLNPSYESFSGTASTNAPSGLLQRGRSVFMPATSEYDDDEGGVDVGYAPIHGDHYALNTWDEDESEHKSNPEDDLERGLDDNSSFEAGDGESNFGDNQTQARRVKLFRGNLVLDCPVSDKLLQQYPEHEPAREFTHMRYSAATTDPAEFVASDFSLRQMCYSVPRTTELVIAVTIYNEDDVLLARTLQGVFNNVRHLCGRTNSKTWGHEAWKKVVVVVIADGRSKINPRAKALMAALGAYQEGFAKNMVNDRPVEGHIYEYTTMVRIAKVTDTVKLTTERATPVQMIFCLKEKNKKKINSHRWLFQALCPILRPNVVCLLDAGTRPGNHAIYHLWKAFDRNPMVAGACGEIAAGLGSNYTKLFNPLVAAQNFEYKMSNILDKPCESVFGFITVLPGAFSAYRYDALQNDELGRGPLEKYFKGEKLEATGGIFSSNMYLAEDRVLCWELVAKRGCNYILKYVASAKAHTDVPEGLAELILQRRRWLNGSFFAGIYAQVHMFSIWRTNHSLFRKLSFHLEFLYQTVTLVFSWFSLANFFLVFQIITSALGDESLSFTPGKVLSVVLTWIYVACLVATFVLSFGNRPKGTRGFYVGIVTFFAILMAYIMFGTIFIAVKSIQYSICKNGGFQAKLMFTDSTFRDMIISLLATYVLYIVSSTLFLDPWHLVTSFFQYMLLSPTYINIMNVYAFCNTHDISWGTKGDTAMKTDLGIVKADSMGKIEVDLPTSSELVDAQYSEEINVLSTALVEEKEVPSEEDQRIDYYALFRSSVVLIWVFMNIALIAVVLSVGGLEDLLPSSLTTSTGGSTTTAAATAYARRGVDEAVDSGLAEVAIGKMWTVLTATRAACTEVKAATTEIKKVYLAVILWSVAGMAAYRFVFCILFQVFRIFRI